MPSPLTNVKNVCFLTFKNSTYRTTYEFEKKCLVEVEMLWLDFLFGLVALFTRASRAHSSGVPSLSQSLDVYWLLHSNQTGFQFVCLLRGALGKYSLDKMSSSRFSRTGFLYNVYKFNPLCISGVSPQPIRLYKRHGATEAYPLQNILHTATHRWAVN
jgi:hypothetical protein